MMLPSKPKCTLYKSSVFIKSSGMPLRSVVSYTFINVSEIQWSVNEWLEFGFYINIVSFLCSFNFLITFNVVNAVFHVTGE